MKLLVADTNLFLRFLLKDIPGQFREAREILTQARQKKLEIIIPQIVIFEIEFGLSKYYGLVKREVIEKLRVILSSKDLKIQNRGIFMNALKLFERYNISFVDCFLKAYGEEIKGEVFTFDKNFKKLL